MTNTSALVKSLWNLIFILVLLAAGNSQSLAQLESGRPALTQTDILIDARVIEMDQMGLREPLTPQSAAAVVGGLIASGFAVSISDSVAQTLAVSPHARILQRYQFTVTDKRIAQSRIGSRISLTPEISQQKETANDSSDVHPEYLDAGIEFELTPELFPNRELFLTVSAQVLVRRGYNGGSGLPEILFKSQRITHGSRVAAGETFLMGGFLTDTEARSLVTMPALINSPILSYLFRQRERQEQSEILVMLTPHLPATPVSDTRTSEHPAATITPAQATAHTMYTVQVGAFRDPAAASALVDDLGRRYSDVLIQAPSNGQPLYRVRVGRVADLDAAKKLESQLRNEGFEPFVARLD